ncbi:MAG: hypothetical protein U0Q21_08520 [Dermatophilaceae bacterium]|mgnify:CR=1 FL=1
MTTDLDLASVEETLRASLSRHADAVSPDDAAAVVARSRDVTPEGADRGPGRRLVLLGGAAAGVAAVAGGAYAVSHQRVVAAHPGASSSGGAYADKHPPRPWDGPATAADNIATARAEVDRLFALVERLLPAGATPSTDPPLDYFSNSGTFPSQVVRTGDWTTALSPGDVRRLLERETPGLRLDSQSSGSVRSVPVQQYDFASATEPPSSAAFIEAGVGIAIVPAGTGSRLLARVSAIARPGRADGGFVTDTVTSIRVRLAQDDGSPPYRFRSESGQGVTIGPRNITDAARIGEIVAALNGLPMAVDGLVQHCRLILAGEPTQLLLTLTSPTSTTAVRAGFVCGSAVRIGHHAALDGSGPEWAGVVADLLRLLGWRTS